MVPSPLLRSYAIASRHQDTCWWTRCMLVYVACSRWLAAIVLLVAALLKVQDPTSRMTSWTLAFIEGALAMLLVTSKKESWRPLALTLAFFLVSCVVALWRGVEARGVASTCGCLGQRVPLLMWQQLLLSALLATMLGGALIAGKTVFRMNGHQGGVE